MVVLVLLTFIVSFRIRNLEKQIIIKLKMIHLDLYMIFIKMTRIIIR